MPKLKHYYSSEDMPPLTLEQAKALRVGDIVYHRIERDAAGMPRRWRVNGAPQTWKRSPDRVKVPVKNGLYRHGYITEASLVQVSLVMPEFRRVKSQPELI